jgi:hypothetical protein
LQFGDHRFELRDYTNRQGGYARLMYGETKPQAHRMMQLSFNRSNSFPRVLVAQSLVGREGLNLHESYRIVVLYTPSGITTVHRNARFGDLPTHRS